MLRESHQLLEKLVKDYPARADYRLDFANVGSQLGGVYCFRDKTAEGLALLRAANPNSGNWSGPIPWFSNIN